MTLLLLCGCAGSPAPRPVISPGETAPSSAPAPRRVAVVTGETRTVVAPVDLGMTRGEGAAAGAAAGGLEGAGAALEAGGEFGLLLLPFFLAGGALVGSVAGAGAGQPSDALAAGEQTLADAIRTTAYSEVLVERVRAYANEMKVIEVRSRPAVAGGRDPRAPDRAALADQGFDAALRLSVLRVSLDRSLFIEAEAKLVALPDGETLRRAVYRYASETREADAWLADAGGALADAIRTGLGVLAEYVVDELFLLYHPPRAPDDGQAPGSVPYYAVQPVRPPLATCMFCSPLATYGRPFAGVDSTRPTFEWAPFTSVRTDGRQASRDATASDVRYEVRVFEAAASGSAAGTVAVPTRLIYRASDIAGPSHRVDEELAPCSFYFWTVRARFELEGRQRVTEWSGRYHGQKPWDLRRGTTRGAMSALPWEQRWHFLPFSTPGCT